MAKFVSWLMLIGSLFDATLQFYPNALPGVIDSRSSTHRNITELVIHTVAVSVIDDNLDAYPARYETLSTESYREALTQLAAASARPDLSDEEKTRPDAHFDSEEFITSSRRIADLRRQAVSAIKAFRMETARDFAGRAIHTLQDFYSHSNWIELGNTNRQHPGLDFRSFAGISSDAVAPLDQATCVDCNRFLL